METTLPNQGADQSAVDRQTRPAAPSREQSRVRGVLSSLLAGALLLATGYGTGRLHGWLVMREQVETERSVAMSAESERREELSRATELLAQLRAQRVELATFAALQDGYRYTQLALDALDARNFGTAETHLRAAERTLQPLSASVLGLPEQLERLAGLQVAVASDIGQQRAAVSDLAHALSSLLDTKRAQSPAQATQP
jgi:hypothetical protein